MKTLSEKQNHFKKHSFAHFPKYNEHNPVQKEFLVPLQGIFLEHGVEGSKGRVPKNESRTD